jgi:hypothetical protein
MGRLRSIRCIDIARDRYDLRGNKDVPGRGMLFGLDLGGSVCDGQGMSWEVPDRRWRFLMVDQPPIDLPAP